MRKMRKTNESVHAIATFLRWITREEARHDVR